MEVSDMDLQDQGAMADTKVLEMNSGTHYHPHRHSGPFQQRTAGPIPQDSPDRVRWIVCLYKAEVVMDQHAAEEATRLVVVMVKEEEALLHQVALGEVATLVRDAEGMVLAVEVASEWAA